MKNQMKKLLNLLLISCFVLGIVGCKQEPEDKLDILDYVYMVNFESNGGTKIKPQTVVYGKKVTKPTNPSKEKFVLSGHSAGGHLAAMLGCFWKENWLAEEAAGGDTELLRPNGMILSYPVITSGEFAHRGSFDMLMGEKASGELLEKLSLEKQVTEDTPKSFIWHTFEDGAVPVENSLMFAKALRQKNIPFELHIYPKGGHGLGLGNELTLSTSGKELQPEVNTWIHMAEAFIKNL